jgi:hypothetical protein
MQIAGNDQERPWRFTALCSTRIRKCSLTPFAGTEPAQQSISMKTTTPRMDSAGLDGQVQPIGSAPAPE